MVGFTLLSRSYYYLRRRSPGPPFLPDHRQAGERGAIRYLILSRPQAQAAGRRPQAPATTLPQTGVTVARSTEDAHACEILCIDTCIGLDTSPVNYC
jgi:hypothetical protein